MNQIKISTLALLCISAMLFIGCKKEVNNENNIVVTPIDNDNNGGSGDNEEPQKQIIKVIVQGIENVQGKMNFAFYNSASTFNNPDKAFREYFIDVTTKPVMEFEFDDIPAGTYALGLFHDENSNYELDQNFIGIPREGFAFSNNAFGSFGPPSYQDAKFDLPEGNNITMTLTLRFF